MPPPSDDIACLYDYHDGSGALVLQVVRTRSGEPRFRQRRPDGNGGWIWSTKDIPAVARPLYRLPGLRASGELCVWIAEGEKDCDSLHDEGLIATTSIGGAGKWQLEYAKEFRGKPVVVLPDNDKPGRNHAEMVARSLVGIAASIKVLALPGLANKQDVTDWLDAGHTVEELERLADGAPEYGPPSPFLLFADIKPALDTRDFVEGLLTSLSLAVVYGESRSRKTFWVLDICLHIASGRERSGREVDHGAVLYCALEGGAGIRNRVAAARRRLGLPSDTTFVLVQLPLDLRAADGDTGSLIEIIRHVGGRLGLPVRMVVVDTLSRAMRRGKENGPEDMGALIGNADRTRFETGTCVLFIHHCGKDAAKGSRGHSSLKAATDTEIEIVSSDDGASSTATVVRQRDLDIGTSFKFSLDVIELGSDRRGKPITSCIVTPARIGNRPKLFGEKARAYDLLTNVIIEQGEFGAAGAPSGIGSVSENAWRDAFYAGALPGQKQDTKRKAFVRTSGSLIDDLRLVRPRQGITALSVTLRGRIV